MQFIQTPRQLTRCPKPCVDTGMGLERLGGSAERVHSTTTSTCFGAAPRRQELTVAAPRVPSLAFLVVDGVIPSNEGRGYVLRRIIRRAIRHGYQLGQTAPFFNKLVPELSRQMGDAYPELPLKQDYVMRVLKTEEERFAETLENGMKVLEAALADAQKAGTKMLSGETAFTLYDTFGFPLDLTADVCRERGFTVDQAGFDAAMGRQRERARAASTFRVGGRCRTPARRPCSSGYKSLFAEGRVTAVSRRQLG
jgi:alanyl-tRNA synthetase